MISVANLSKYYSSHGAEFVALNNINLHIAAGEIFGVVGKSGAGKSTLIRCLNLLEKPSCGHVVIDHQDLTKLSAKQLNQARHHIAMIFQHFNLLSSKTVFENVALPLRLVKQDNNIIEKKVNELLDLVGLTEKSHHYPSQLSGGQKQRVAIARALANDPNVLLCDEATSALDPETTKSILSLLKAINKKLQLTIVLITHEMEVIKQICDRVALLEQGEIIEQQSVEKFFTQPITDAAKKFIHSTLKLDLPEHLQKKITTQETPTNQPVLRIIFNGQTTQQAIISHLISDFRLAINILQANIESIHGESMGILLVSVAKNKTNLPQALEYLQSHGLIVEGIGYVD